MKYYIDLILILVSFIWGLKPIVIKYSLNSVNISEYNVLRFIFATISSWIFLIARKEYKKVSKEDYKRIIIISLIGFFIFQWLYGVGISKTTAGNASIIMGTLPILVLVINCLYGKERIKTNSLLSLIIAFIGTILVIFSPANISFSRQSLIGGLYIFIAALAYAIYMVFSKPLSKRYKPSQIITYAITITTIMMIIISRFKINFKVIDFKLFLSLLYTGVISMFLANYLWTWALQKSSSTTRVAIYNNLNPVFTVLLAYVFLGEKITIYTVIGIIAILSGLILK